MKALKLLLAVFSISIIAINLQAYEAKQKEALINEYVADYYEAQSANEIFAYLNKTKSMDHPCNPGNYDSCLNTACSYLDRWDCDSENELKRISNNCRGNYNGDCIDAVCSHLRSSDCGNDNKMMRIISSCSGNWNGNCVRNICQRLPSHDCNDVNELISIASSCARH